MTERLVQHEAMLRARMEEAWALGDSHASDWATLSLWGTALHNNTKSCFRFFIQRGRKRNSTLLLLPKIPRQFHCSRAFPGVVVVGVGIDLEILRDELPEQPGPVS